MTRLTLALAMGCSVLATSASAQLSVTFRDISPNQSNNSDPDGATGGRVDDVTIDPSNATRVYTASEFGGVFRSTDGGLTWAHLDGHVPHGDVGREGRSTNWYRVQCTRFEFVGSTFTSHVTVGTWPSRCAHVRPPSVLRNTPPNSDAAYTRVALLGSMVTLLTRPPVAPSGSELFD